MVLSVGDTSGDQVAPKVLAARVKAGGTMARMTRTQITLEEDEYLFLKTEAAQRGGSLSSVVRELVRERMDAQAGAPLHVWELAGLLADCEYDGTSGADHDRLLAEIREEEIGLEREEHQ
jgi:hypothetical protein